MIYKQDYYEEKLKGKDDLFIEYLVPFIEDLDNPAFIE